MKVTRLVRAAVNIEDSVRTARTATPLLLEHLRLTLELAHLEWTRERQHIRDVIRATLVEQTVMGLALLYLGALPVVAAWDTPLRLPVAGLVLLSWIVAAAVSRRRLQRLLASADGASFAATREELRKTIELLGGSL